MMFFKTAAAKDLESAITAEDKSTVERLVNSGFKIKVQIKSANPEATFDYRTLAEQEYRKSGSEKARKIFEYLNSIQHARVLNLAPSIPVHPRSPRAGR